MLFQPFLTPVPPRSDFLVKIALLLGYSIGVLRVVLILALCLLYVGIIRGACLVFVSIKCDPNLLLLTVPGSFTTFIPSSNWYSDIYHLPHRPCAGWCLVDTS